MATKRKVVPSKPPVAVDDDLLGGINTDAIDDLLEGIDADIPPYKIGDKIEFVHGDKTIKGSVHKVLQEGNIKAVNASGTLFNITTDDILKEGEIAEKRLAQAGKRGVYKQTELKAPGFNITATELKKRNEAKGVKTPAGMTAKQVADAKKVPAKKPAKAAGPNQRELVEALLEKGIGNYDTIADKTGVTRTNVGQYAYRWKKANPKEAAKLKS